ncbi:MAG: hypothetical protein MRY21_05030 [Simkaniaceae bacterium]|nr:hypothetical protein [Simkaniaceae bacterium]
MQEFYVRNDEYRVGRDKVLISPIERDRQIKDEENLKAGALPVRRRMASIMLFLEKLLALQIQSWDYRPVLDLEEDTTACFLSMYRLLEDLKKTDLSISIPFATTFSRAWNAMLVNYIPVLLKRLPPQLQRNIKGFQETLRSFPKGEDHTLGYYLTEYAGENWLPFPFINLIRELHIEHALKPETSTLSQWTELLKQIIEPLTGKKLQK